MYLYFLYPTWWVCYTEVTTRICYPYQPAIVVEEGSWRAFMNAFMVLFVIRPLCWVLLFYSSQSWMKCYAPWYVSYFHGKQDSLPMQLHFCCHHGGLNFVRLLPCLLPGLQMTMLSYMFHWLWCILLSSLKWLYTPKGLISMILVYLWTGKCTEM